MTRTFIESSFWPSFNHLCRGRCRWVPLGQCVPELWAQTLPRKPIWQRSSNSDDEKAIPPLVSSSQRPFGVLRLQGFIQVHRSEVAYTRLLRPVDVDLPSRFSCVPRPDLLAGLENLEILVVFARPGCTGVYAVSARNDVL